MNWYTVIEVYFCIFAHLKILDIGPTFKSDIAYRKKIEVKNKYNAISLVT